MAVGSGSGPKEWYLHGYLDSLHVFKKIAKDTAKRCISFSGLVMTAIAVGTLLMGFLNALPGGWLPWTTVAILFVIAVFLFIAFHKMRVERDVALEEGNRLNNEAAKLEGHIRAVEAQLTTIQELAHALKQDRDAARTEVATMRAKLSELERAKEIEVDLPMNQDHADEIRAAATFLHRKITSGWPLAPPRPEMLKDLAVQHCTDCKEALEHWLELRNKWVDADLQSRDYLKVEARNTFSELEGWLEDGIANAAYDRVFGSKKHADMDFEVRRSEDGTEWNLFDKRRDGSDSDRWIRTLSGGNVDSDTYSDSVEQLSRFYKKCRENPAVRQVSELRTRADEAGDAFAGALKGISETLQLRKDRCAGLKCESPQ